MFSKEPPPPDNPLIGRSDVVCTPHLGASTTEAQEGVALEIAEAVVSALKVHLLPLSIPHHLRDTVHAVLVLCPNSPMRSSASTTSRLHLRHSACGVWAPPPLRPRTAWHVPQMQKRDLVRRYCAFAAEAQDGIAWHSTVWHSTAVRAQGELAATAVNAPMVPAEVLAELQPFCQLAQGLGTAAVQLVGSHGFTDIHITYATSRGGAPWTLNLNSYDRACHASTRPGGITACVDMRGERLGKLGFTASSTLSISGLMQSGGKLGSIQDQLRSMGCAATKGCNTPKRFITVPIIAFRAYAPLLACRRFGHAAAEGDGDQGHPGADHHLHC